MNWLTNAAHARWLERESDALLGFAAGAYVEEGFGSLDTDGLVMPEQGAHLWITSPMIHCCALGSRLGRPGAASMVGHGLRALSSSFHGDARGGCYAQVGPQGPLDDTEAAY